VAERIAGTGAASRHELFYAVMLYATSIQEQLAPTLQGCGLAGTVTARGAGDNAIGQYRAADHQSEHNDRNDTLVHGNISPVQEGHGKPWDHPAGRDMS